MYIFENGNETEWKYHLDISLHASAHVFFLLSNDSQWSAAEEPFSVRGFSLEQSIQTL